MYAVSNPYLPALRTSGAPGRLGVLIAVALHASALAAVLSYEPARSAMLMAAPIMVNWIAEPKVAPRRETPKPKPIEAPLPKPVEEPPVIAASKPEPAPAEALTPPPPPQPAIEAVAPPPVITLPVFNANYLDNPAPPYPALSRRLGEQGRVTLRVLVSAEGRAEQVRIQTSSGFVRLDTSAGETVRGWKFLPAKRGAESVPAWVLIPISFKLES